jgi:hypothetical protein
MIRALHERGWALARLRRGTKMAFEKGWPDLIRTPDDILPGENVGVIFGERSGGLVDIDLDIDEARALVSNPAFGLNHFPEFGRSSNAPGRRGHRLIMCPDSPGRSHVYGFRSPDAVEAWKALGLDTTILEVRANGQTAIPPSVITDKGPPDPLVWSSPAGPHVEIPEMAWGEVLRRMGTLAYAAASAALLRKAGSDIVDEFQAYAADTLAEAGVEDVPRIMAAVSAVARCGPPVAVYEPGEALTGFSYITGSREVTRATRKWLGLDGGFNLSGRRAAVDHPPISAEDLANLLDALDGSGFVNYFSFRDLMFACHDAVAGSGEGLKVFLDWSRDVPTDKRWSDPSAIASAWHRASDAREVRITMATLLMHVQDSDHPELVRSVMRKYEKIEELEMLNDEVELGGPEAMLIDASEVVDPFAGKEVPDD